MTKQNLETAPITLRWAARDYLSYIYDEEEGAIDDLVNRFHEIASAAGSSAKLCVDTASVQVLVSELAEGHPYAEWLEGATYDVLNSFSEDQSEADATLRARHPEVFEWTLCQQPQVDYFDLVDGLHTST